MPLVLEISFRDPAAKKAYLAQVRKRLVEAGYRKDHIKNVLDDMRRAFARPSPHYIHGTDAAEYAADVAIDVVGVSWKLLEDSV